MIIRNNIKKVSSTFPRRIGLRFLSREKNGYHPPMRITCSRASRAGSLIVGTLLLASCGGSSGTPTACTQQYWNGRVGICLPDGWRVLERERLDQQGIPQDVVAAFQVEKPVSGQYPTVVVTQEPLSQTMDTTTYSLASMRAVSALPGYALIDTRSVNIDTKAANVHIYTAQPAADQPKTRFSQVSAVSPPDASSPTGTGYTVTAFAPLSLSSSLEAQELAMVESLTFVEPGVKK